MTTKRIVYMVEQRDWECRSVNHRLFLTEDDAIEYIGTLAPYITTDTDGRIAYFEDECMDSRYYINPYIINEKDLHTEEDIPLEEDTKDV